MGTISDKLMRIINTKEDIRQALISKGYDVPTSIPFKEYAKMISDLPCRVDSFPDIEGIVARYSALGLTNEQMATNPVWVDKTGNGHDLQMKNFAWKGMSGVGGYEMNFNLWGNNVPNVPDISMSTTTTSVSVSVGNSTYNNNLIYIHINNWDINKNHWLKVTSTYEDGDLAFLFYENSNTKKIGLPANGYVNILAYPEFKGSYMYISTTFNKQGSFTIEQLPLYPGALVFDGVDDYGVCDNFPILNKEKGYTVVALRQWIEEKNSITALVSNSKNWNRDGAFVFEYNNLENNFPNIEISFGSNNIFDRGLSPYSYQTSKSYNGNLIESGSFLGSDKLVVAKANENLSPNSNIAIWELVFLDHDATEEELTKIKDYFVKTYPWLFPDQAWTVVGKTNEDEDRATIANITGNGNDLVLSNFAFSGNSGYGSYVYNFNDISTWIYYSYNGTTEITSSTIHVTEAKTARPFFEKNTSSGGYNKMKIKVTGIKDGEILKFMSDEDRDNTINIEKDGIYSLPGSDKLYYGFRLSNSTNTYPFNCDITIEQIPEYEGYLVTDGVDDKVVSAESIAFTDTWTIITDTVFLGKVSVASGILASNIFTVYNYQGSGTIAVAMGDGGSSLRVITSSIKAFSSDGTIYDAEWNEYHVEIGTIRALERLLKIGTSSNETSYFCQLAFKFLGIYNNQILSKEDCIKAYNYLQTLK